MTASAGADVFTSGAYWRAYYARLGHENRVVGEFLQQTATASTPADRALRVLDAGCGPTTLYWAAFLPDCGQIEGFDSNPGGIGEGRRLIAAATRGRIEPSLLEPARVGAALAGSPLPAAAWVARRASQVARLQVASLAEPWPFACGHFDLVMSCFAFEAMPSWRLFGGAVLEAARVLRPGGRLALAMSRGTRWECEGQSFPTLEVGQAALAGAVADAGLALEALVDTPSLDAGQREQGYDGIVLLAARRRRADG